jgi:hypothetical protein
MKPHRILILALAAAFALPATSFAAKGKGKKGEAANRRSIHAVQSYDTNKNGQIDGDEVEALKKAFTADPKGALAFVDKNSSGTLEEDEISALNARLSKRAERLAKKGQKKNNKTSNNT